MKRRRSADYERQLAAAARLEPLLARALLRAFEKMQESILYTDLASAIAGKDTRRAVALLREQTIDDALAQAAMIVGNAVLVGGTIGAELLNEHMEEQANAA